MLRFRFLGAAKRYTPSSFSSSASHSEVAGAARREMKAMMRKDEESQRHTSSLVPWPGFGRLRVRECRRGGMDGEIVPDRGGAERSSQRFYPGGGIEGRDLSGCTAPDGTAAANLFQTPLFNGAICVHWRPLASIRGFSPHTRSAELRRRPYNASSASGSTRVSASTGMKLLSPSHRGTTCRWR